MQRPAVGVIAIGLFAIAAAIKCWAPANSGYEQWMTACVRIGTIMAVVWLAMPAARDFRTRLWLGVVLVAAVVLIRWPKLLLPALVAFVALALLRPRPTNRRDGPRAG
jgi:hypothetical protein